jgi:putative transposase
MLSARNPLYRRHRFPPEVISHAGWLYFQFPLSLRTVEEMLAERGICVSYETVRQWAMKFSEAFPDQIRQRAPCAATNGILRSRHFDRRRAILAVACGRSKRLRARRSGSASKRQRRPHAAARHDQRQAPILRRGRGQR